MNGAVQGIGFAIGPTLALTARHVIQRALDASGRQSSNYSIALIVPEGIEYSVRVLKSSRRLDIALLTVTPTLTTWLETAEALEGRKWQVDSRPRDGDPMLSGWITSCARPLATEDGGEAVLLQLHVQQLLGDYSGYSGSPVRLPNEVGGSDAIGVLIEQARWRKKEAYERLPPVANVLYAVPVTAALTLFGVGPVTSLDRELEAFRERMRKIKNIESEADSDVVREARKEVLFRYVFGE